MDIYNKKVIADFIKKHPQSQKPLLHWVEYTEMAIWHNFADVRDTFRSADLIAKGLICFNIAGNKYRLIAEIDYQGGNFGYRLRFDTRRI
ncbi:MAG: type II toxin-antitoxin system HigB family toxin [Sedimentisphaerales bacterium]|nr:type II toxin-antitoxin system HigB family toxin [Sedimentisphaerales bacterium]MBN2842766.1 type II toxin-antitoxin system HigB family toxin [Sedimentisphaerales bacterium]